MDNYERHALADRELRVGLYDSDLMNVAIGEAKGISAVAREIYLERRSKMMKQEADGFASNDSTAYFQDLLAQVVIAERRFAIRNRLKGWAWVLACLSSATTSIVLLFFAASSSSHGNPHGVRDIFLACIFSVLAVASFVRARRVEYLAARILQ